MKNKFIIIIPAYNVSSWITLSLELIKLQSYDNFECVIIDDNSTDDTNEKIQQSIQNDDRFHLLTNTENIGSSLANFIKGFDYMSPDDEDIIVRVDGDDWLSSVFVLEYLNIIYVNKKCWLTYGTYQVYPTNIIGTHHCIDVPDEIHNNRDYRKWKHVYSHLRTHKAFLLKNVNRVDLKYPNSNDYFREAEDVAHMFPLVEMCGKDKIYKIADVLLVINRINPMNVATVRINKQKETEHIIRSMNKYSRVTR
jgi:glycosyltransferase involved in cell wall biosynthesis